MVSENKKQKQNKTRKKQYFFFVFFKQQIYLYNYIISNSQTQLCPH